MSNESIVPRVLVRISGGVCQEIITDGAVDVYILDEDNIEQGDEFDGKPDDRMEETREEFDATLRAEVGVNCSECSTRVHPEDEGHGTPCGTFCEEHLKQHMIECKVCNAQFQ